jgi:formate hydrogenlyase subunit 4
MNLIISSIFQIVIVLLIAPMSVGLVRFFKARFQGRHGAWPWLPYLALATMMNKENVISTSGSWMLRLAPYAVLGTTLYLTIALPLLTVGGAWSELSNFLLIAGVLALGSAFLVLGSLDVGSAFGGMGGSREMTIISLLEPTTVLIFSAFAIASGDTSINGMVATSMESGAYILTQPYLLISMLALVLMALAENARYPVDNPATHLELTMVHEANILDYSGPYLAMMEYASTLKLTIFGLLVANFIWPWPLLVSDLTLTTVMLVVLATCVKLIMIMFGVALLESTIAKLRFYRIQEYLTGAFFLALTGLALTLLADIL